MSFSPGDCTPENLLSAGSSGCVHARDFDPYVLKIPLDVDNAQEIEIEKRIYERLTEDGQQHCGLLEYFGSISSDNGNTWGIRLQRTEKGSLASFLLKSLLSIPLELKLRWASQLAAVLGYFHSKGVVHCDLGSHNILLDTDLNVKLMDFGGSSIDGSQPLVTCLTRNRPPWFDKTGADVKADIFALGSVLYAIMTGRAPLVDTPDRNIPDLYRSNQFPEVASLEVLGDVIHGCWMGSYETSNEVLGDIEEQIASSSL
ncbi:MAG: hypothetical protein M1812_001500 [Candelaria pacifica]|nr:MAG: hypothetical protein M1812_001500 [Candelaria pacifica]